MSKFKMLFFVVLVIAILEGIWIFLSSDLTKTFYMGSYFFNDMQYDKNYPTDDLVSAEGSWIVPIKDLAMPLQTIRIECWKQFGHCWIADASISKEKFLSVGMDLREIAIWNNDVIETKSSQSLLSCVDETYRLDRKAKTVTYTRRTINTSGICEGVSTEPIVAKLGDGLERLELYRQLKK